MGESGHCAETAGWDTVDNSGQSHVKNSLRISEFVFGIGTEEVIRAGGPFAGLSRGSKGAIPSDDGSTNTRKSDSPTRGGQFGITILRRPLRKS
jgi:hypothetical protein